jgi:4-hydroxybenzoate polyprenyltransferase
MGLVYLATVIIIGALFVVEHRLVNPDDLKHIDIAFFHVNSVISVLLFAGILADEVVRRWT